jgi:imidazolonepropionase
MTDRIPFDVPGAGGDVLVTNIGRLETMAGDGGRAPRRGAALADTGTVTDAALLVRDGRVLLAGPRDAVEPRAAADGVRIDAGGRAVIPGFVDPHTHAVFGRTRQDEYERRIRGETYLEIAAAGGGIHSSVRDLRERSEDELVELAVPRLAEMLRHGTTTVEIKSGYGLSLDDELKMLRAAGRAAALAGIRCVRTCLAAHEMPKEYADRRADYVRLVTDEVLPQVAGERLAERCDVFCEPTVFTLAETEEILTAARGLGLGLTVHADELAAYGGAALAARLGASSADHLIRIDEAGIAALAASDTVATLLPGTVFTLGLDHWPPARRMIEAGCAVALATDFNPGSSPILSMPLILAIACTQLRLVPGEALVGATYNSACALGLQDEVGSLAPGRRADFVILDGDDHRLVPYHAGRNPAWRVFVGGAEISA